MLKKWGTWFGVKDEDDQLKQQDESVVNEKQNPDVNKSSVLQDDVQMPQRHQNAFFSDYMYNFASNASKKLSDSVVETAQTIKKSVEEGTLNGIIDKTILGDFQKEQEKFVQEKKSKKSGAAVPPWVGVNEEETVQQQILALSADKRNFLRDPPAGVQFHFDCEQMYPVALVMLEEDELLRKMRFHLVPKEVKEETFWKNYFYRVSLIKQSAQLTALVAQQAAVQRDVDKAGTSPEDVHERGSANGRTVSATCSTKPKTSEDDEQISTSPPVAEFVSDAFDSCKINEDDLRKEMEQLVLDKKEHPDSQQNENADWEKELQEELQEYDVLDANENQDDNWDKEIEEMLKEDS